MMLCIKILVVLCVVINITNGLSYYYRRNHKHRHRHVYNCGYQKCIRKKSPPVCKQWCIIFVNVGYCQQPKYTCCSFREKPGYCPVCQAVCAWPFPYYLTHAYECQHDFNCPSGYKCCNDSCYVHKVCKPTVSPGEESTDFPKETEKTTPRLDEITTPRTTTAEIATTTPEIITAVPTTTQQITTTTEEETTATSGEVVTEKQTTEEETTTTERVTAKTQTTIVSTITTEKATTKEMVTQRTTTVADELEGSGELGSGEFGSGEIPVPEPESARFSWPRDGTFNDDEDLFRNMQSD